MEKNMKNKISVEICGYLRTFIENIENWKENLLFDDKYEYHLFFHIYDNFGYSNSWTEKINREHKLQYIEIIKNNFENVDLIIESDEKIDLIKLENFQKLDEKIDVNRTMSMFRKIYLCNLQKREYEIKNNLSFGYSIRIRPDLFFNEKINLDLFINNYDSFLMLNNTPWEGGDWFINHPVYNDQFAFGDSTSINNYSEIYLKVSDYVKECKFHAESLLYHHLKNTNMNVIRENLNFFIKRKN
jgi:hypothetical protein